MAATGLAHEDRVVVLLRRSVRLVETILALWKCGAAYVPADPDYPDARIKTIVDNSRAALVITEDGAVGQASASPGRTADPATLAYVIYTSGSTGVPKGAMVEHAGLLNHVLSMIDELAIGPGSRIAQTASHCFDISMWQMFAALAGGGTTVIYRDALIQRPVQLARRLEADRVSLAQFVPSYLNVFLDAIETLDTGSAPRLPDLRHMVTIGEALKPATIARWFRLYPSVPLMNAYGPTEASDSIAHFDMTGPRPGALVPIGRPIQNLSLYIVDDAMRQCPIGVKGEICVAGVGVGRGDLFDEERTRAVFALDPFSNGERRLYHTGDTGCYAPDGTILFFGRRDFQVKIRGHRIELGEIESSLMSIDGVREAAVVVVETGPDDRVLCAYVTAQAGHAITDEDLATRLSRRLPLHMMPDVIRVLPDMPVMTSGKIDRRALAARGVAPPEPRAIAVPVTPTERTLARIWSDALECGEVDVDRSFFDLGGHSLKAIQIASRIHRDCGVEVSVADVFSAGTVRRLAARVDGGSTAESIALSPVPPQEHYETSPAQQRIWLASRTPDASAAYNMGGAFWLGGPLDVTAMRRAFRALIERHEALRTEFLFAGGVLRQRVRDVDDVGDVLGDVETAGDLQDAAIDAMVETRLSVPFDLARSPLFGAELLRFADRRHLLIVRLHHIVGDATSIAILLQEALALYAGFTRGEGVQLPALAVQYRDFIHWQKARSSTPAADADRVPRSGFTPDAPSVPPAGTGHVEICHVDATMTARLRESAARHGVTLFGMMVASIYALIYRYSEQEDVAIGSTVSLRDHPLLERQIGCYIDTRLIKGRVHGADSAAELIERTGAVCRDAIARRNGPPAEHFNVLIDYLPNATAAGTATDTDTVLTVTDGPRGPERTRCDSMFLVEESDSGRELSIRVVFDEARFRAETAALARRRLQTLLEWLAADDASRLTDVDLLPTQPRRARRLHIALNTD